MPTTVARRPVAGRPMPTRRRFAAADHVLLGMLGSWAQRLQVAGVPDTSDYQFVRDLQRDDVATRQPNHTLCRMVRLAIETPDLAAALGLSEAIRQRILIGRGTPVRSDREANIAETIAEGAANLAQLEYSRVQSPAARAELIARLEVHAARIRELLDVLYAAPTG